MPQLIYYDIGIFVHSVNSITREKVVVGEPVACYEVKRSDELCGEKLIVETVGGLTVAVANVRDLLSSTKFEELDIMEEEENLVLLLSQSGVTRK